MIVELNRASDGALYLSLTYVKSGSMMDKNDVEQSKLEKNIKERREKKLIEKHNLQQMPGKTALSAIAFLITSQRTEAANDLY
ncbi:hypothetical protein [Spongorhabdus nitratireducens]